MFSITFLIIYYYICYLYFHFTKYEEKCQKKSNETKIYNIDQFDEGSENYNNTDSVNNDFEQKDDAFEKRVAEADESKHYEDVTVEPVSNTVNKSETVNTVNHEEVEEKPAYTNKKYVFPPLSLLKPGKGSLRSDRNELANLLSISNEQLSYVTNSQAGQGLIFSGNAIIPFIDKFPKDTKLYQMMTTKPEEVQAV